MPTKQASAAVGQCELMYIYDKLFTEYNHTVAQLLITAPDIEEGRRAQAELPQHARAAFRARRAAGHQRERHHLHRGVRHRRQRYALCHRGRDDPADLLILLSDIDGLFDGDPRKNPDAKLIDTVEKIDEHTSFRSAAAAGRTSAPAAWRPSPRRADGDGSRLRNGHRQRPVARGNSTMWPRASAWAQDFWQRGMKHDND